MKEAEKKEAEEKKRRKQVEREKKKQQREEEKKEKDQKKKRGGGTARKEARNTKVHLSVSCFLFEDLELSSNDESDAVCPKCGWVYSDDDGIWICCDGYNNNWYDIRCTNIRS